MEAVMEKRPPDISRVEKILVIMLRHIGDVLLATPSLSALRSRFPKARIDALVNADTRDILVNNPSIDRLLVLDRGALKKGAMARVKEELRLLREVRAGGYDMAVVLLAGGRALNIALLSGARIRVGARPKRKGRMGVKPLTFEVEMAPSNRHYVERGLDILRSIGIDPPEGLKGTVFFEGDKAAATAAKLLEEAGIGPNDPYILVHPTSRWMFKCWPVEKTSALVDRIRSELGVPVVLTSGPAAAELEYAKKVISGLASDVVDLTGRLTLLELGALIRGARVFFGVDSAPMHMAAAVSTPAVAIFGPTNEVDWGPWGEGHRVITSGRYAHCRPCGKDGCNSTKVSDCLVDIEVSTVFSAVRDCLSAARKARANR